jgi:transposase
MHTLLLRKKSINKADCSGDGTGYSLTISKHYATESQKMKERSNKGRGANFDRFVFSFKLMDLDTRMYIGYGTSFKSERDAYQKAIGTMNGMEMNSIRLDKYYSGQGTIDELVKVFGKGVSFFLVPKRNATVKGSSHWKDMLSRLTTDPEGFLQEYFRRNQSESGFSEDKRRFGWKVLQRREDRIETNDMCTSLWHNMFWYARF